MAYEEKEVFTGIDIGTNNYSFAVYYRNTVRQLADKCRSERNPCFVFFHNGTVFVGLEAESQGNYRTPQHVLLGNHSKKRLNLHKKL